MPLSNGEFLTLLHKQRQSLELGDFNTWLLTTGQFVAIVNKVEEHTNKFKLEVDERLGKLKKSEEKFSPEELLWKKYFQDHTFNTAEDQRNMADALCLLTGIDILKFIKITRKAKGGFPSYVCIVPTGNSNHHDYRIGSPIFNFTRTENFYKNTGAPGNSMSSDLKDFRVGTREEIISILSALAYRMSSAMETLLDQLVTAGG
jgi:hypothetical protein